MSIRKISLHILGILLLLVSHSPVKCEFEYQPKIQTEDGTLIFEAVRDKNITFRLLPDSLLYVNDINVLDQMKPATTGDVAGSGSLKIPPPTIEAVSVQVKTLKTDLQRLTRRFSNMQNRTRANGQQQRQIQRLAGRLSRVLDRANQLELNLGLNECEVGGNPCKNGATCYDAYKDFHCECMEGWTGKTCEDDLDECYNLAGTDLGCQNNAACVNTHGSYRCSCRNGYAGTHCRIRNAICETSQPAELCGHGTCVHSNNPNGYTCICDQGWTKNNATPICNIDVNECDEATNPCHSECINLPGSFKCGSCPIGYTGNGVTCYDIDECLVNNGGCSQRPRVSCINSEGSFHCGNCPPGWLGDGRSCQLAPSNSCNSENICHPRAKCQYISETVVCTCPPGMFGHGFGPSGCSGEESTNPCENHECKNNGTCQVTSRRGTSCICPLGFMGPLCEKNDACTPNPCQNDATCNLLPNNKFRCACQRGSTGNNCEIRRNICGSIIRQESGELSYPEEEGANYEANERCAWIIRTSESQILNVTFTAFDVDETPECIQDWLQIHDGRSLASQLIGRFCGRSLPLGGNIVSSHQQLFFWFRSDNATNRGGFKLTWSSHAHVCGGSNELDEDSVGVIRSPGYPGKTRINHECEWELKAPYGHRIVLRFYEVNLGSGTYSKDVLRILDSDQVLKSIEETSRPDPLYSSSNIVVIHFHTDSVREDSSFQLHYEVVAGTPHCGGIFTEPSGTISGFMNAPVCVYLIQQPPGTKVQLEITKIRLICEMQSLEIFDGKTDEDPLIKRLCGREKPAEPFVSNGNFMLLRYEYKIPGLNLNRTFEAKYSRVCDAAFFGPDAGVITTPNYPKAYFEHMICTYDFYGPINTIVNLNFTDFSMTETTANMASETDIEDHNVFNKSALADDFINYVDVYLSIKAKNKRRFYKGSPMYLVSEMNRMRIVFHSNTNENKLSGFRVEYSFERILCGGVLTDMEGSFSKVVSAPVFCEWIIQAPEGRHISLDLTFNRIGSSNQANVKYVYLYSNSSLDGSGKLLGSYNDDPSHIKESYHTNVMTIALNTLSLGPNVVLIQGKYTLINSSYECGGNFSARSGTIRSPSYPDRYGPSTDCVWIINAPVGHQIELFVEDFSLESTSSFCTDDSLEIRNGHDSSSPLIGTYCGYTIPKRIPSFTNHLYLHFVSDDYISDTGFSITWEQTETGCGGLLNSHKGSIHSPHNANIRPGAAISCDWEITIAQGSTIDLNITSIGEYTDLCGDSQLLRVYDGPTSASRQLALNCSAGESTLKLKSSTNRVLVRYTVSDEYELGQQFVLDYNTNCNIQFNSLQGSIESPNFPENYPSNMACVWDIRGGRNNKISLAFSHLQVERRNLECAYDYVEVLDMRNDLVLSSKHLCMLPSDILTTEGNRLMVKFVSDYADNDVGFRAEFKRLGCGEHLYKEYGNIETPNAPYSVDMDCDWYIEVPAGKQIQVHFKELHIETEVHDCSRDALIVSEDYNSTAIILKECQIEQIPITVTSPGNRLYIHFLTSDTRSRKYFKATFNSKEGSCGGIFRSNRGLIATPNYPNGWASNVECVWTISVENSYGINLIFDEFNTTDSDNCVDTYVEFHLLEADKKHLLERVCGQSKPLIRLVHGNRMSVTFKTGPSGWGKFAMRYQKECGGLLTNSVDYIKSRPDEVCEWQINSSEGSHISVDILRLECQCQSNTNCSSGLQLSIGVESQWQHICEQHETNIVTSINELHLTASKVNFLARYSTIQNSCGGFLTSLRGILASPYYPGTYPSNVECIWEIQANNGNRIELNFEMLDIAKSEHCNADFLELRTAEQGQLLGLYCSNDVPTETLNALEKVWIKFRSTDGSTGNGFKLAWNYAHTNELNGTEGKIQPPPLNSISKQEAYSWRIMVERGQLIELNFKEYNTGLNLYDGFDQVALPIAIGYSPWQFVSSTNVLYLTSNNADLERFLVLWKSVSRDSVKENETISDCRETIVLSPNAHVTLTSPGYPHGYANNLKCEWTIKTSDPIQHSILSLFELDLEEMQECSADYLRVSSSNNLQNWHEELQMCHKIKDEGLMPIQIVHGTPHLKMEFSTDVSINGTGFKSLLTTACGSNLTGPVGTILSSQILLSRAFNSTCLWHIEVRQGKRIEFTFEYGGELVKSSEQCRRYAVIYDGLDDGAPILPPGQICNQEGRNIKVVQSSTNRVMLKYNLAWDMGMPRSPPLWNLTWREFGDCDGEVRLTHYAPYANISTPNYPNVPQPFSECDWVVIGPPGVSLQANFIDRFDMNTRYCSKEFVELFDGSTTMARSLGKYCYKPNTVRSTGNVLHLRYQTEIAEPRNGFRVNVSISVCGGSYTAQKGEITSSNYPAVGAYPKRTICDYSVKFPTNSRIRLNFTDLHLPYDRANVNASDRLEILAMGDIVNQVAVLYANETELPVLEVDSSEVLIRFSAFQGGNSYRGFKLKYERIFDRCSRDISGDSGMLVLGKMDNSNLQSTCRWKITVPKGQRVSLEIRNLELEADENINLARFRIALGGHRFVDSGKFSFFNDIDMLSKITELKFNDFNGTQIIKSTDNYMMVRIQQSRGTPKIKRLQARYSSDEEALCPPDISETEDGSINIQQLSATFACRVQFTLSGQETITFNITELQLVEGNGLIRPYAMRFKDDELVVPFATLYSNVSNSLVSLSPRRGSVSILQSDFSRILRFSVRYKRNACGGLYTLEQGFSLDYDNIREPTSGPLECVWTIKKGTEEPVYRLMANVSLTDTCEREYIVFYGGLNREYAEIIRICRDSPVTSDIVIRKPYTMVLYHAEGYRPKQSNFKFIAEKSIVCGSKTNLKYRSETIAVDAKTYKNNFECNWEFQMPQGWYISLTFTGRFFIEESVNCTKDYLEVLRSENNLWIPEARFCGREVPRSLNITSNSIQVVFRTNEAITGDGFTFQVSPNCNVVLNASSGTQIIQSPSTRNLHVVKMNCEYTFQTHTDKLINVRVYPLSSPFLRRRMTARECDLFTYIKAFKHDTEGNDLELGRYCFDSGLPFEVSSNRYLRLHYLASIAAPFKVEYELNTCGGNITTPTTIRPLQHEERGMYADNMNCIWYVEAPADHSVVVRFKYFEMEHHSSCNFDYVAVYYGKLISDEKRVTKLCGNLTADRPVVVVDGNRAVIAAVSDISGSGRGFLADILFTRNCNERITLTDGNSPLVLGRQYKLNASEELLCHYRIAAPKGYRVSVELKDLQLTSSNTACPTGRCEADCDHIELLDSVAAKRVSLGRYCGNAPAATVKLLTSYEEGLLKLNILQPGQYSFEIILQMEQSICGGLADTELELQDNQFIGILFPPPGFFEYKPNTHCTWRIKSSQDFQIVFDMLLLQNASQVTGQCLDYLHIKGDYYAKYFCGNATGFVANIEHSSIRGGETEITFHSDDTIQSEGFHITARHRNICNNTYTKLSDLIKYTSRGSTYASICVDEIRVPVNYTLSLYVSDLFFRNVDCSKKHIKIIDIYTNETLLDRCHNTYTSTNVFTTTNAVRVLSTSFDSLKMFYVASNRTLPPGCGGQIYSHDGEISNPPYNDDRNHSECRWDIMVAAPNRIEINFNSFNMGTNTNCHLDYIQFLEILPNGNEKPFKSFCGQDVPERFISPGSHLAFISKKSPNFDGVGWTLTFETYQDPALWLEAKSVNMFT